MYYLCMHMETHVKIHTLLIMERESNCLYSWVLQCRLEKFQSTYGALVSETGYPAIWQFNGRRLVVIDLY